MNWKWDHLLSTSLPPRTLSSMNTVQSALQEHCFQEHCHHEQCYPCPIFLPTLRTHMSSVHPYLILLSRLCFLFYVTCFMFTVFRSTFYPVPCFMLCSVQFCSVIQSPCFVITCHSLSNQLPFCFHLYLTALMSEFCVLDVKLQLCSTPPCLAFN